MWSNLRDVAGKISSVVAPPPTDDDYDDGEDYDDDDGDDGEEEYDEDGEEYEEESERNHSNNYKEDDAPKIGRPFGFVGLITRAMDQSDESHEPHPHTNRNPAATAMMMDALSEDGERHHDQGEMTAQQQQQQHIEIQSDDDDDEIDFGHHKQTSTATTTIPPSTTFSSTNNDTSPVPPPPLFVDESSPTRMLHHQQHQHRVAPPPPPHPNPTTTTLENNEPPLSPHQRYKHLPRYDSMDDYQPESSLPVMRNYNIQNDSDNHNNNDSSPTVTTSIGILPPNEEQSPTREIDDIHQSPVEPVAPRFSSLVRESGSVSPQRTSNRKMNVTHRLGNDAPSDAAAVIQTNISSRSLGSTPNGQQVLLSPLQDILQSEHEQTTTATELSHVAPPPVNYEHGATADPMSGRTHPPSMGRSFPRDALLGSFSVPNDTEDLVRLVDDDATGEAPPSSSYPSNGHESQVHSEIASVSSTTNNAKKLNRADSGQLPAAKHRGSQTRMGRASLPMISLESFDENDDVDHSHGDSSASTNHHLLTSSEPPLPNGTAEMVDPLETIRSLELKCNELQAKLMNAESQVAKFENEKDYSQVTNHHPNVDYESLMIQFQEKETRLLQAANEEHQHEIQNVRYEMNQQILTLQQQLLDERQAFGKERDQFESSIAEHLDRIEQLQSQARIDQEKHDTKMEQIQQQQTRALRKMEDQLAHTTASLESRENDTRRYRDRIKELESKLSEQNKGANEVEEEVNELHNENDILHDHIERLQAEAVDLRQTISKLEGDSEKLVHLKMELRMLKEDHSREKAKIQTVAASAESSTAQLEAERDEALAKVQDLQIQLSAAVADWDVAKSDAERIMQANANLQSALEAFQNERDAEMAMIEEHQREREKGLAAKHAAILDATHEANQAEIRQIQQVSDAALQNSMEEIKKLEDKLETYRIENIQTRRSLDEAIKRLQATQDDVIDRTFMKNILLDWLTKNDRKEKVQVLEIMASVLHFSDAEKEKVHIDDGGGGSLRKLVVPPPPKVDLETLEGDNVREKWVNFLIAEADD